MRLADLDTAGREKALDAAARSAHGGLKGLVLLGPIGVGKSTIAAATAPSTSLATSIERRRAG